MSKRKNTHSPTVKPVPSVQNSHASQPGEEQESQGELQDMELAPSVERTAGRPADTPEPQAEQDLSAFSASASPTEPDFDPKAEQKPENPEELAGHDYSEVQQERAVAEAMEEAKIFAAWKSVEVGAKPDSEVEPDPALVDSAEEQEPGTAEQGDAEPVGTYQAEAVPEIQPEVQPEAVPEALPQSLLEGERAQDPEIGAKPEDILPEKDIPAEAEMEFSAPEAPAWEEPDANSAEVAASAAPVARPVPTIGFAGHSYNFLSYIGFFALLFFAVLLTAQGLYHVRALWFSDEVRHASVYLNMLQSNDWFYLTLNGLPYPDKPPVYFWFLYALDQIPYVDPPMLFFAGVAASTLLFVAATWLLAVATGHNRKEAFAAGLICLTSFFFVGLTQYPRMDLLFGAVIAVGLACMYRAWIAPSAFMMLTIGFVLAAVATLIKGPLALAFLLVPSFVFLLWRGRLRRLNGRDGILGFALMLLLLFGWLAVLYQAGHVSYIQDILGTHVAGRMFNAWHHAAPWWYYLAALPLVCLPWIFLPFFTHWGRGFKATFAAVRARGTVDGRDWLWIVVLCGVGVLSALSGKLAIYLLPLFPALAILAARPLLNLSPKHSRLFFAWLSLIFFVLGLALVAVQFFTLLQPWIPAEITKLLTPLAYAYLDSVHGTAWMGLVLVVLSVVLLAFTRRSNPGGALLVTSIGMICFVQVYVFYVAPSLETILSPRAPALALADYAKNNFSVAAYRVYPGVFSYDAGQVVPDMESRVQLEAFLATEPKAAVIMPWKDWGNGEGRVDQPLPADLTLAKEYWMVDQRYALVVQDKPLLEASPAVEAEANAPAPAAPEQQSLPEALAPFVPLPEGAAVESAAPEAIVPEVPAPEAVAPEASTPEATTPEVTTPDVVAPEVTAPETAMPEATAPENSAAEAAPVSL